MGDTNYSMSNFFSYGTDGCQRVSYCRSDGLASMAAMGGEEADSGTGTGDGDGNANDGGDGLVVCKDLVLGCKPEKADDFRPFVFEPTWCVYIRAQNNEDLGRYVRQVTFRMSPRLPLRLHVADSSPFEITEVLSTDFPVELQVDYLNPVMTPTTYVYKPDDVFDGNYNVEQRMSFMGHERKDKMFFVNPPLQLQLQLQLGLGAAPDALGAEQSSLKQAQQYEQEQERHAHHLRLPAAPRPIFNVRPGPR
ncbi:hypothetical protein KR222_001349 [Zaprionus bogoriensis]|nr:hypothetical protein KR222_001349 [Zaprionus bogoriensis]